MREIIEARQLKKSFGKQIVVDNISLLVTRGMVFGLLGANGAGKSTTIECILGTKKADEGQISVLEMNPHINRKKLFEKVGVQFQETSYQDQIMVAELCEVTASLYHDPVNPDDLLTRFGIIDKRKNFVKDLSGGQKQRLFIVLALIPNLEVVFLDELTTGPDTKARREVWKILSDLKDKGVDNFFDLPFYG